jgi:hypothetical protein
MFMEKIENNKYYPRVLQALYLVLVLYVGGSAIALLVNPNAALSLFLFGFPSEGIPYPSSLIAGVAYSMWLTIALLSVLGLRSPYKYSPVLLFVVTYKIVWVLALALPRAIDGTLMPFGQLVAISFVFIAALYAFLAPWRYLFSKSK